MGFTGKYIIYYILHRKADTNAHKIIAIFSVVFLNNAQTIAENATTTKWTSGARLRWVFISYRSVHPGIASLHTSIQITNHDTKNASPTPAHTRFAVCKNMSLSKSVTVYILRCTNDKEIRARLRCTDHHHYHYQLCVGLSDRFGSVLLQLLSKLWVPIIKKTKHAKFVLLYISYSWSLPFFDKE